MEFPEYEKARKRYNIAVLRYESILREKERLFDRVLPNAVQFDKEKVNSTPTGNKFDDYVIQIEEKQINTRLKEAEQIIGERGKLLKTREQDLRSSRHYLDIIYTLKELDCLNAYQIANKLHYSKSQIYRALERIDKIKKKG